MALHIERSTSTPAGVGVENHADGPDIRAATPERKVVSRRALKIVGLLALVDLLAILGAYLVAKEFRIDWWGSPTSIANFDPVILATAPAWLVVFFLFGLYSRRRILETSGWAIKLLNAVAMNMVMLILVAFAFKIDVSRSWTVLVWLTASAFVLLGRLAVQSLVEALNARHVLGMRSLVVGVNSEARTLARVLRKKPRLGYEVLGFVGGMPGEVEGLPVVGRVEDLREAVTRYDIATVFVAGSSVGPEVLAGIDQALIGLSVRVRTSLGLPHLAANRVAVLPVDGMAMMSFDRIKPTASELALKRVMDVALSAAGILLGLPVMIGIAIAIKLGDGGPIFFAQERVGEDKVPFTMYKFRTMVPDAEQLRRRLEDSNEADGGLFKLRLDPRITRIGRHLRKLGLDELPQLFNILRGDMSLVGPRPALPSEVANWSEEVQGRLDAKPGLTGLWQVSGRHELAFEDYVRYDLFYVQNWSLSMDLQIVARTLPALLSRRGAY